MTIVIPLGSRAVKTQATGEAETAALANSAILVYLKMLSRQIMAIQMPFWEIEKSAFEQYVGTSGSCCFRRTARFHLRSLWRRRPH